MFALLMGLAALAVPQLAHADANAVIPTSTSPGTSASVINNYQQVDFSANDDGSWPCGGDGNEASSCPGPNGETGPTAYPLGFDINFYHNRFGSAYVNNNGNITFDGYLPDFTPSLSLFGSPIIAPFLADVDTLDSNSQLVNFGTGTLDGRKVFVVNWPEVGCYEISPSPLDDFQLILIDRADRGSGANGADFDIEFNYDTIAWDTGQASGSDGNCINGPAGNSAYVGYSNGTSANTYNLPGSGTPNAFLDSSTTAGLIHNDLGSSTPGRYLFPVNNGQPAQPTELTTTLSGGGHNGDAITVPSGTGVTDQAILSGGSAAHATGTVTYSVYSDSSCANAVSNGSPETITSPGTLPASRTVTLTTGGTYYWQVKYSGDTTNGGSVSACLPSSSADETETVTPPPTCQVTALLAGPPKKEQVTVRASAGLASIYGFAETNGTHGYSFTPGTTGPVVVTETKANQSRITVWSFYAKDDDGQTTYCH